ncbi:MAG TPA: ATP-binding protein, partial [Solirubrobacteraceae bacterium]|nr:ATP-binding protein [Solirubrobacteraceae bacterium]
LRGRLTLLYGACFLVAGAALLAITYGLVRHNTSVQASQLVFSDAGAGVRATTHLPAPSPGTDGNFLGALAPKNGGPVAVQISQYGKQVQAIRARSIKAIEALQKLAASRQRQLTSVATSAKIALVKQHNRQLAALLTESGIALGIMAVLSIGLGWLMAGRALRPLRTMNQRARAITEHNLHERLALEPRGDELGELAETFDGLLGRLQRAFDSQRRFVANASHELRTPITLERALVEVALADPDASVESLRECCRRVLAAGEEQERLIEALLTLARSQGGIEARERVDLASIAAELAGSYENGGSNNGHAGLNVSSSLGPAVITGDRALIERLVANLVDNAAAYNVPVDGWVRLWTGVKNGRPTLRVANSGPAVPPERVDELFEPFRRLDGERLSGGGGLGLGLSIVSAITTAHRGGVRAVPLREGGLEVVVSFPPAPGQKNRD